MTSRTPTDSTTLSPKFAEVQALVDAVEDEETLSLALLDSLQVLLDIVGEDPMRPTINRPGKLAKRAVARVRDALEAAIEQNAERRDELRVTHKP